MARLLALFIVVPAVELALLIELGRRIGTPATLALIVVTGVLGASLARRQGLRVVSTVQRELAEGRLPASSLLDGLMILIASALLVTPGVLTDVVGFLCLYPAFRSVTKAWLRARFERAVAEQRVHVHFEQGTGGEFFDATAFGEGDPSRARTQRGGGRVVDIDPADYDRVGPPDDPEAPR